MVIRNYLNKLIFIFLLLDPFYDWLAASPWNPRLAGISLTDLYLVLILALSGLFLAVSGARWLTRDPYIIIGAIILLDRLFVDMAFGLGHQIDYLPRGIFNLVLYAMATRTNPARSTWGRLAVWSLAFYLVLSLPQLVTSMSREGRVTSIFGNPNFLAFNALNMIVLLAMFPIGRLSTRLSSLVGMILIVLSKTRSVLLSSLWFIGYLARRRRSLLLAIATLVILLVYGADFLRLGRDTGMANLNGRFQIWRAIMSHFHQINLFFGNGSDVASRFEIIPHFDSRTGLVVGFTQPQNHYLLVLIETGMVGLMLWIAQIVIYLRQLRSFARDNVNVLAWCFVMSLLTIQFLENEIFANPTVRLIMGLAIAHGRGRARVLDTDNESTDVDDDAEADGVFLRGRGAEQEAGA